VGVGLMKLESAIIIAAKYHSEQTDKCGQPYILHPLRVMLNVDTEVEKIVAVLHDTLEDTSLTEKELRNSGADDEIIKPLLLLTQIKGQDYNQYLTAILHNVVARNVKIADIADNLNPIRLNKLPKDTQERLKDKYHKALELLK
jgi:(p)ppGpp synthase/HD superfamily hydrolase